MRGGKVNEFHRLVPDQSERAVGGSEIDANGWRRNFTRTHTLLFHGISSGTPSRDNAHPNKKLQRQAHREPQSRR